MVLNFPRTKRVIAVIRRGGKGLNNEQLKQVIDETYNFLSNKDVGFICYIWEKSGEFAGGCQSIEADIGDAMVVIHRITKHFNIDPQRLFAALMSAKREMEKG